MAENVSLGRMLRAARREKGLTLGQVGRAIDASASYVSQLETGHRVTIDPQALRRLAKLLSLDPVKLTAAAKGAFELPVDGRDHQRQSVGAALAREWRTLTSEKLRRIGEIVESDDEL